MTTRTKRDTKRQNLFTLLTLKFKRVHNLLSFMGNAMHAVPSHPMGFPFPWTSLEIIQSTCVLLWQE